MELGGGFAGEVDQAIVVAGVQPGECGFEEGAGFAETGRGFEVNDWLTFQSGGEVGLGVFLAGA